MNAMAEGVKFPGVVVRSPNAFEPMKGRTVEPISYPITVQEWVEENCGGGDFDQPTLCLFNGGALLRGRWTDTVIGPGDCCEFMALPHGGGGGGGGGKNPLRTVLMVAVVVAAAWAAGAFAPALGEAMFGGHIASGITTAQLGIAKAIIGGAVALGGGMLVNAVVPAPKPASPSLNYNGGGSTEAPSPTYSLTAQGNQGRLGQPIPVVYGRHKVYPDLGAEPYQEYVDNEQFLHQLHVVGQGYYAFEATRIDDTPISSFEDVQTEVVEPGGTPTLFHVNVTTASEVAGQELEGPNVLDPGDDGIVGPFSVVPEDETANKLGMDAVFSRGLYYANTSGGLDPKTARWKWEAREIDEAGDPVAGAAWVILGAHIAASDISITAADKSLNSTTTDFQAEGVKVGQRITTAGFANGGNNGTWTVTAVTATKVTVSEGGMVDEAAGAAVTVEAAGESYTDTTNTPIRLSYEYQVSAGRYEVRGVRLDNEDTDSRAGHELRWGEARAYLASSPDFGNVTLLLVKMRATDNLSNRSSRQVNVIVTRKLTMWDANTQSWTSRAATRSIVAAILDCCRAEYGGRLSDSRISLDELAALDAVLEGRGNYFDAVFDTQTTVWDALTRIARCGRAVPIQQGGLVRVIRDSEQSLPVAMFTPRNIIRGSFEVEYLLPTEDTADGVTVEYWDKTTWKRKEVTRRVRDAAYTAWLTAEGKTDSEAVRDEYGETAERPAKVRLFGCTEVQVARDEADYMAANNRYRRVMPRFTTANEGMIPTYGDLIMVGHPMPRWGKHGEVTAWTGDQARDGGGNPIANTWDNAVLTLSEPLEWEAGQTHWISLRKQDGSLAGPFEVTAGSTETEVVLQDQLTMTPYVGSQKERTHFSFGPGEEWGQLCRLQGMVPRRGGSQVEMVAVAEDSRVHVN